MTKQENLEAAHIERKLDLLIHDVRFARDAYPRHLHEVQGALFRAVAGVRHVELMPTPGGHAFRLDLRGDTTMSPQELVEHLKAVACSVDTVSDNFSEQLRIRGLA